MGPSRRDSLLCQQSSCGRESEAGSVEPVGATSGGRWMSRTFPVAKMAGPVSFPVNETLAMENFQRSVEPDTWLAVRPLTHHGAALHYRSVTTQH